MLTLILLMNYLHILEKNNVFKINSIPLKNRRLKNEVKFSTENNKRTPC